MADGDAHAVGDGFEIRMLAPGDASLLSAMSAVFAEAFEDPQSYLSAPASQAYLEGLLRSEGFIAIAVFADGAVVGGVAAYELLKFEQERSEIYLYDLAVESAHRRQGVATALIRELQREAGRRGAWVVYVQADAGDEPAVALYTKLGVREDVMHFDFIPLGVDEGA